jgi:ABC-type sugar transport system permease subunit
VNRLKKISSILHSNKSKSFLKRRTLYGYIFILPWIIGFLLFFIQPLFQTIIYSFNNVTIINQKITMNYAGLLNFQKAFFEDPNFLKVLVNSITGVLIDTPMIVIFSLFASTLIHKEFPGRWLVRLIFFLPIIYGTGFLVQMQEQFTLGTGVSGYSAGTNSLMNLFVDIAGFFPGINIIVGFVSRLFDVISRSGVQILIFLAGLNSIPTMYYEASTIDGARDWDNFWLITLPVISPFILMNTVYTIVDSFTQSTNGMIVIIYDSINKLQFSYGSARSTIYFACIFIIVLIVSKVISRKVVYSGGEF